MKRILSAILCIAVCILLSAGFVGCAPESDSSQASGPGSAESIAAASEEEASDETPAASSEASGISAETEAASDPAPSGILSSPEDIDLRPAGLDEPDYVQTYRFDYDGIEFTAQYMEDNWTIFDSYRITDTGDMEIICEALLNAHPVHGCDMISIRTPEDMVYEWEQHNIAYENLPEDSKWRENVKDVDFDPADQGKTLAEMYKERTGQDLVPEDLPW